MITWTGRSLMLILWPEWETAAIVTPSTAVHLSYRQLEAALEMAQREER